MRTTLAGGLGALAVSLMAVSVMGCPQPTDGDPTPPPKTSPLPLPAPTASAGKTSGQGPGVAGPARPRHPHPDDGVSGTHLLATREITVGGKPLTVWIADTEERRRLGLMHVKSLPEDRGMLFVYPEADRLSFWMKNTYVPLSLAYISGDGRIDQILDMQPHVTKGHPSRGAVRLVLEVNQGWFERNRVRVGARIPGVEDLRGY